jgi:hypothetical protein
VRELLLRIARRAVFVGLSRSWRAAREGGAGRLLPRRGDYPGQDQCQQRDHQRAADEFRRGELPAHQQPQHDPQLKDEVRGAEHERLRGGEVRAPREQRLGER